MLLPACDAVIVQVPAETSVSVVPLTVHTEGVLEVNCTLRPDVAVAESAGGATPMVCVAGAVKLMVCAPITKKDFGCVGAAAKVLLPGCEAVMMQVPGATRVSVLPLTVHTDDVLEVNCTAKPEVAVAESAEGVLPKVWSPGEVKLMLCVACTTVKLCVRGGAAA